MLSWNCYRTFLGVLLSNFPTVFFIFLFFSPQKAKKTNGSQKSLILNADRYCLLTSTHFISLKAAG